MENNSPTVHDCWRQRRESTKSTKSTESTETTETAQKTFEQQMEKNVVQAKETREGSGRIRPLANQLVKTKHLVERLRKVVISPVGNALHISLVWLREEVAPKMKMPLFCGCGKEGKEKCKALPDDLVEKIVASMPFPAIFKARCLSKAWLARFSSISSQDGDEGKTGLAISFQRQVREWSGNWDTFYPVFIGENEFVAYDRASHKCRIMPSLSFLPDNVRAGPFLEVDGALVYGYGQSKTETYDLYVANFLTQTWKRLPCPPTVRLPGFRCKKLVRDEALETYKLILIELYVRESSRNKYFIDIYDSQSHFWSSKEIVSQDFPPQIDRLAFWALFHTIPPAYFNGVLYVVNSKSPQHFRAINLEEGTMRELTLSFHDLRKMVALDLAVWNGNVFVIVIVGEFGALQMLKILQIDMASLRMIELASHPCPASYLSAPPVSSGSCIYFNCGSEMLLYNFDEDGWSYFSFLDDMRDKGYVWLTGVCRPGLSPFLEV